MQKSKKFTLHVSNAKQHGLWFTNCLFAMIALGLELSLRNSADDIKILLNFVMI